MRLNLGCGKDYREGYINADISEEVDADIIFDMTERIPFVDNQFYEVVANNCLTQIEKNQDFIHVINELWRVTKGDIYIRVPNVRNRCAFQDPMDCRRFTKESFTYMEYGHRRYEQYGKHYGFKPFRVKLLKNNGRQMEFKLSPVK